MLNPRGNVMLSVRSTMVLNTRRAKMRALALMRMVFIFLRFSLRLTFGNMEILLDPLIQLVPGRGLPLLFFVHLN
jgi:hypothetical protein